MTLLAEPVRCPNGHPTVAARLSVAEGMWYCGDCNLYYGAQAMTPPQPETPYYGRPSERP